MKPKIEEHAKSSMMTAEIAKSAPLVLMSRRDLSLLTGFHHQRIQWRIDKGLIHPDAVTPGGKPLFKLSRLDAIKKHLAEDL